MKNLRYNGSILLPGFKIGQVIEFNEALEKHGGFEPCEDLVEETLEPVIDRDSLAQKADDARAQIFDGAVLALLLKNAAGTKLAVDEKKALTDAKLEVEQINSSEAEIEKKLESGEPVELPDWAQ